MKKFITLFILLLFVLPVYAAPPRDERSPAVQPGGGVPGLVHSHVGTVNQVNIVGDGTAIVTFSTPQDIDTDADVEFDSITLDDLTALRLVATDALKMLISTDLASWVTGSAQIIVTDDGDGTITLTASGLVGLSDILGTANQIIVTDNGDGTVTLSTPQDIDTSADVTFDSLVLDDLTASRLVATDGSKELISSDLVNWVTGTASEIIVTDDLDGTITLSVDSALTDILGDIVAGTGLTGGADDVLPGADADVTLNVQLLKDLVTTAPLTGGTDDILVGADSDVTLALTVLKDIVVAGTGMSGGENNVLPGADADTTITLTTDKDIVAGNGLTGGEDDVLPGADADTIINVVGGDGVTASADEIEVYGLVASDGDPNDAFFLDAAGKPTAGYSLDVTGTMAATTVTGTNVTSGADPGHTHTGASLGMRWDEIDNPNTDKTFNMTTNPTSFNFTSPSGGPTYDGAFEIQANAIFVGDLFHVHQHTGNPGVTDLIHAEAEDSDVLQLRLAHRGNHAIKELVRLQLDRSGTSDNDETYQTFYFDQDGIVTSQGELEFARFSAVATDVSEDTEDSMFTFDVMIAGSLTEVFLAGNDSVFSGESLRPPIADNPTTDAEGELAWDSNDDALEIYDGTVSRMIPTVDDKDWVIIEPDGIARELPIFHVDADRYPFGVTLMNVQIKLEADAAYSMVFEEWSGADPAVYQADIETVTTGAADTYAEVRTTDIDNRVLDADDWLYVHIPATDVPSIACKILFYVNEGN